MKRHLRTYAKRCMSVALILSMMSLVGIQQNEVKAKVIDDNYRLDSKSKIHSPWLKKICGFTDSICVFSKCLYS